MEALSIRLDQMESIKSPSYAAQGMKSNNQGDTTFSKVLDKALNSTDGVQKPAERESVSEKNDVEKYAKKDNDSVSEKKAGEQKDSDKEIRAESPTEKKLAKNQEDESSNVNQSDEKDDIKSLLAKWSSCDENISTEDLQDSQLADKAELLKKTDSKEDTDVAENIVLSDIEVSLNAVTENAVAVKPEDVSLVFNKVTEKSDDVDNEELLSVFAGENSFASADKITVANIFNDENAAVNSDVSSIENKASVSSNSAEPLFTVIDERVDVKNISKNEANEIAAVQNDEINSVEMTMSLSDQKNTAFTASFDGGVQRRTNQSSFTSMLSSEIKNNAGEFVKTGMITLRDNNKGSINLVLRPEELGNVKIKLELSDKLITGKIIVSSQEAYGAFKNNIDNLRQAFINSGFDNAGFELSWSGNENSSGQQNQNGNQKNAHGYAYAETMPIAAGAEEMGVDSYYELSSVNVVV